MKIKIFGKKDCDACKATKEKFEFFLERWNSKHTVEIIFYDLDTIDGLSEGAYMDALEVPTTIIEKDLAQIARWEKEVPQSKDFKRYFETK